MTIDSSKIALDPIKLTDEPPLLRTKLVKWHRLILRLSNLISAIADYVNPTDWTDATLQGTWTTNVLTYGPIGYRKHCGKVELRGVGLSGAGGAGTTIFTLPAGHRPTHTVALPCGIGAADYITIGTTGVVTAAVVGGLGGTLTLDGLEFPIT